MDPLLGVVAFSTISVGSLRHLQNLNSRLASG